jgi:hypothetical protein
MDYAYVQRGGREVFEPYGYLGFRYVQVDVPAGVAPPEAIAMVVRANRVDEARAARFRSSDDTLNAVFELAVHSTRYGSQEHFVDTPTREQGQFTYDAYQISRAAMRAFGERDLTQRALREFAQSQVKFHADTGKVNAVYPNGDGKRDIPDWTQSWPMWAWEYYVETGDRELVSDLFPQLVKTGEYVKSIENPATGLVDLGSDTGYKSGIVDWPNRYGYDRTTTQRTVMTVNAVLVYRALAGLAGALERPAEVARFRGYADAAAAAIERQLWDPAQDAYVDGLFADGRRSPHASQQANAMMLACGPGRGRARRRRPGGGEARGLQDVARARTLPGRGVRRAGPGRRALRLPAEPEGPELRVDPGAGRHVHVGELGGRRGPEREQRVARVRRERRAGGDPALRAGRRGRAAAGRARAHPPAPGAAPVGRRRRPHRARRRAGRLGRPRYRFRADRGHDTGRRDGRSLRARLGDRGHAHRQRHTASPSRPAGATRSRSGPDAPHPHRPPGGLLRPIIRSLAVVAALTTVPAAAQAPSPSPAPGPDTRTIRDVVTSVAKFQLKPLQEGEYKRGTWEEVQANRLPTGLTWTYQYGVILYGLLRASEGTGDKTYADFVADHNRKASAYASYLRWVDKTYGESQKDGVTALLDASRFRRFIRMDRLDFCGPWPTRCSRAC